MWMLEIEWAWCFCGKYFPNWAVFSASPSSSWAKSILSFNQEPAFYPHLFQAVQSPHASVMLGGLLGQGVSRDRKQTMCKVCAVCSWRFKKHGRVLGRTGKVHAAMEGVARSQTIKKPPMSINPLCVNGHDTRAQHQCGKHSEIPQLASHPLSLSCVVLSELLKLLKLRFLPQETVGSSSPPKTRQNERIMKNSPHMVHSESSNMAAVVLLLRELSVECLAFGEGT